MEQSKCSTGNFELLFQCEMEQYHVRVKLGQSDRFSGKFTACTTENIMSFLN
jgi:hypothetical protein